MENDYKRNYFWIKRDLKGNRHYYFKIKGQYHEVSEEVYKTCYNSFKKEEREKEKRFQVYHNHRSSGSHGVVPFPAETGRAVYYRHSYRWRVQALGRGECEQMDDRKQRAVCRKVVENGG